MKRLADKHTRILGNIHISKYLYELFKTKVRSKNLKLYRVLDEILTKALQKYIGG